MAKHEVCLLRFLTGIIAFLALKVASQAFIWKISICSAKIKFFAARLGCRPTSSNAKDYFYGIRPFPREFDNLLDEKRMDTIGNGPAILSTCVKCWCFFACKLAFCYKIVQNLVRLAFFGYKTACKSSIRTNLYTLTTATNFNAAA